jgi:hypothetical protein
MQDVPQIVVRRLQGIVVTDPHPETELLTAFAEHLLAPSERELVLNHLARCAECRQIIELALPITETENVIRTGPARPGWLSWPALRWGFATAAILALVSLAVLQYEHRQREDQLASRSSLHEQITTQKGLASSPEQSEATEPAQERAQPSNSAALNQETARRSHQATAKSDFQTAAGTSGTEGMQSKAGAVAMARNHAPDQLIQNQAPAVSQSQPYMNSDVVKAKAAITGQASAESVPAFAPPNIPLQTAPSRMQRASPRWTITATGGLQRSFDAGKTWEAVNVNGEAGLAQKRIVFRAVTAIGPEVWAGGSGATLYHSSDSGTLWQQVFPLAAGAQPTGDITDIQFSSPLNGKIATSAGEIWTTSDNGQSWQKQQ